MNEKCLLCKKELDDKNRSVEHIVPNAFGGKLKSSKIFCKKCNSSLGSSIDASLTKNLLFLTFFLNPKTDRSANRKIKGIINDNEVFLYSEGKVIPKFKPNITNIDEKRKKFSFKGFFCGSDRDRRQFYELIQEPANGIGANYTLDEIEEICHFKTTECPSILINSSFSLKDIFLGYLKILLAFCAYVNKIDDVKILELFRNRQFEELEQYCYFCDLIFLREGKICNRIYLVGDSLIQKVYGIVTIYDFLPLIFVLNTHYEGEDFLEQYVYDILSCKEIFDDTFEKDKINFSRRFVLLNQQKMIEEMINRILNYLAF